MTNCLGLGQLSPENPSEWPIMAKKVLLGLVFIGSLAFLGHNFGEVVTEDPVGQIIFSIVAVGIVTAAWYRGKKSPRPVSIQCVLCREWTHLDTCQSIPNINGPICAKCGEHL